MPGTPSRRSLVLLALALLLSATGTAWAQEARVARVCVAEGEALYQRGDDPTGAWDVLGPNTPLLAGDAIFVPEGGRAELDLGMGTVVHLDGKTHAEIVNLDADVAQLGLWSGALDLCVRPLPRSSGVEVDTPYGAATVLEPGTYRFWLLNGSADFAATAGRLAVTVAGEDLAVGEGDDLEITGTEAPGYVTYDLPVSTHFDQWSESRDGRYDGAESCRFANAAVMGLEDLDDSGEWREDPVYGPVWVPAVGPGWVPYRNGRWIWQDPYGWTWVSYEAWGWAPYHYGRWIFADLAWAWVPPPPGTAPSRGGTVLRASYAPAVVGFLGGPRWTPEEQDQPVMCWVPLAPADTFHDPWQPVDFLPSPFTNMAVNRAVTAVALSDFTAGPVKPLNLDASRLQEAPRLGSQPSGVLPTPSSLAAYPGKASPKGVPSGQPKPLAVRLLPPAKPLPFDQKLKEIKDTGRPVVARREPGVGKPFKAGTKAPSWARSASATPTKGLGPHPKEPAPGRTPRPPSAPVHPGQVGGQAAHPKPDLQHPPEGPRDPRQGPVGSTPGKVKTPAEKGEGKVKKPVTAKPAPAKKEEPKPPAS
jgi:hypothetical protein